MKTLRLGFTGTQQGMNEAQAALFIKHLKRLAKRYDHVEIHHGDCIGADEEFHNLCLEHLPSVSVVLHPPLNPSKRAFCISEGQVEREPKDYLVRNCDIVDEVEGMFATPKRNREELRSGTWAAVRYGRKMKRSLILLWPNGTMTVE